LAEAEQLGDPSGDGVLPWRVGLWLATADATDEQWEQALARLRRADWEPVDRHEPEQAWEYAWVRLQLGRGLLRVGSPPEVQAALRDSLHRFQALGDTWAVCLPLVQLTLAALRQGDAAAAWAHASEAVALARRTGDTWIMAVALQHFGRAAQAHGDVATARGALEESAALFEAMGNPSMRDVTRTILGTLPLGAATPSVSSPGEPAPA